MKAQVVQTGAKSIVQSSPMTVGLQQPHKRVEIPGDFSEYVDTLNACLTHGENYQDTCALCIKFATEKAEELNSQTAIAFLQTIPLEVKKTVVDAISRLERSILPALMQQSASPSSST